MGPILALLIVGMAVGSSSRTTADTTTYSDAATRDLIRLGVARHRAQDSTVQGYQATIRYRLSFALGKRAWADLPTVAVEEQEGRVSWERPNNLRVDMLGRRAASQLEELNLAATFNRPLFAPRALGDSIRIFGLRTPVQAAPHPLSAGGSLHYRYVGGERVSVNSAGRTITVRSVVVTPKGLGRSYVAGTLWLDTTTGDVVRFTFRFVGTGLWERPDGSSSRDSSDADRSNQFINRILQIDADLEYALQDQKYWMPYKQVISGRAIVPFGVELAVPFEGSTIFSDYQINAGIPVVFSALMPAGRRGGGQPIPLVAGGGRGRGGVDSLGGRDRFGTMPGGGRYQIHRPSADSLRAYSAWGDTLAMENSEQDRRRTRDAVASLAGIVEGLPGEMTGKPGSGIGLERLGEAFRYNRVTGTALSLSGRVPLPVAFTESFATVRYGFADKQIKGSLSIRRDSPASRWTLTGAHDLVDMDPFVRGLNFGNSIRAGLTGHDEGAYFLGTGVRAVYETSVGLGRELTLTGFAEDQTNVTNHARAGLPRAFGSDGFFPANPMIREGMAVGAALRLEDGLFGTRWRLDALAMSSAGDAAARLAADLVLPTFLTEIASMRLSAGVATGAGRLPQAGFFAGGMYSVRGFEFGAQHGDATLAAQLTLTQPGKGAVKPMLFVDAGEAGHLRSLRTADLMVGAGVGLSFFGGILRTELSVPLTLRDGRGPRFDLRFGGIP